MTEPEQLVLDLAHRPALGAEDFLVSDSNRAAVTMIDSWPGWPQPSVLVVGPARSGKTHLAHVWELMSGATIVAGTCLGEAIIRQCERRRALVVEDIDQGIADERALFHLLNMSREEGGALLLTSSRPAGELSISLPDLRSRLRALPMVRIEPPDEALLRAVLVKLFADRQLSVEPHVVAHLALNGERSMESAVRLVEEIDRHALATRRRVTRALAAEVLGRLQPGEGEAKDGHGEAAA
jgi:chromosomal replication initiation ATPase DnaA